MEKIKMRWTGIRPMLMHNGELADPLNEYTIKIKEITAKGTKKQTEADHEALQRLEWEGSLYWDEDEGLFVPSDNIERCLQLGGQKKRVGKDIQSAVFVSDDIVPLKYEGPKDLEKLYGDEKFRLRKGVVIQGRGRTIRTRPRIPSGWSIEFTLDYDERVVSRQTIAQAASDAGTYIGLGDWHPKYGRFEVEVLNGK